MTFQKVLLTGCLGGIGSEIKNVFQKAKIKVVGSDYLSSEEVKEEMKVGLEDYIPLDLSQLEKVQPVMEEVSIKHPDIDLVINNAGIANLEDFLAEGEEGFNKVMDINFHSLVISCRFWLKFFNEKGKGHLANMASMAGIISPSGMTSYSASKHAVVGFSESLRLECESMNMPVGISLIAPGFINTDIMKIGEENGLPEQFKYFSDTPERAAKKIVQALLNKESFIVPDTTGKLMGQLKRWTPGFLEKSNSFLAKKIRENK